LSFSAIQKILAHGSMNPIHSWTSKCLNSLNLKNNECKNVLAHEIIVLYALIYIKWWLIAYKFQSLKFNYILICNNKYINSKNKSTSWNTSWYFAMH